MAGKVVAMLILGTLALTGCVGSPPDQTRRLNQSEAQLMAVTRFKNYNAGTRGIVATIRDGVDKWTVMGWYDYAHGVGYASLTNSGSSTAPAASAILLWSQHSLFSRNPEGLKGNTLPPLPAPNLEEVKKIWGSTSYQPQVYAPQAALLIIASLGFDRPENPLLLQQSDALWLREDHIGKTRVNVFAGPTNTGPSTGTPAPAATGSPDASTVRYWLDESGLMLRVEMRLGGAGWSSVELHSLPEKEQPLLPRLDTSTSAGQ
jgi:hypothetical protein